MPQDWRDIEDGTEPEDDSDETASKDDRDAQYLDRDLQLGVRNTLLELDPALRPAAASCCRAILRYRLAEMLCGALSREMSRRFEKGR
jgi:hypothetical protein